MRTSTRRARSLSVDIFEKTGQCPYCKGKTVVKVGFRQKKLERIQLYFCQNCQKKFTPSFTRGKTYPLPVILSAISFYNRLYTLEQAAAKVNEKYGLNISPQNISNWLKDFAGFITFARLRSFISKKYSAREALEEVRFQHGQIYDFKYHRAKLDCILSEEYRHYKFAPLQEFLELTVAECPHQVFRESSARASSYKKLFDLDKVKITSRPNTAVKNTRLVLQAVENNKLRHQVLQEFMILNDSVTVAAEVPVLLDEEDLRHFKIELGFAIPDALWASNSNGSNIENSKIENFVITGHIDLIQVRNGAIHIMDFKPSAKKEKCVDQLTIYALALSRLTGLRLYHFKCAWFDEEDYFEFFPLHVVYKKKKRRKKKKANLKVR